MRFTENATSRIAPPQCGAAAGRFARLGTILAIFAGILGMESVEATASPERVGGGAASTGRAGPTVIRL